MFNMKGEVVGIKFQDYNFQTLIKKKLSSYSKGDKITMTILRNGKIGVVKFLKQ